MLLVHFPSIVQDLSTTTVAVSIIIIIKNKIREGWRGCFCRLTYSFGFWVSVIDVVLVLGNVY